MRVLSPESQEVLLACLELAGPVEGFTSVLEAHSAERAPATTHDLTREMLDLGISLETLQSSLGSERMPLALGAGPAQVLPLSGTTWVRTTRPEPVPWHVDLCHDVGRMQDIVMPN